VYFHKKGKGGLIQGETTIREYRHRVPKVFCLANGRKSEGSGDTGKRFTFESKKDKGGDEKTLNGESEEGFPGKRDKKMTRLI